MKTTSLDILEKSKLPHEQVHAILKTVELEIADSSARLEESLVKKGEVVALKGDFLALRGEFHALELKFEERFGKLETKIEAQTSRMILWLFGATVAQATFLYTVLSHKGP